MNISIKHPNKDTCSKCDEFNMQFKVATEKDKPLMDTTSARGI